MCNSVESQATRTKCHVFLNEVKIALNLFSKSYHNFIIVWNFEMSSNNVTILIEKLSIRTCQNKILAASDLLDMITQSIKVLQVIKL